MRREHHLRLLEIWVQLAMPKRVYLHHKSTDHMFVCVSQILLFCSWLQPESLVCLGIKGICATFESSDSRKEGNGPNKVKILLNQVRSANRNTMIWFQNHHVERTSCNLQYDSLFVHWTGKCNTCFCVVWSHRAHTPYFQALLRQI